MVMTLPRIVGVIDQILDICYIDVSHIVTTKIIWDDSDSASVQVLMLRMEATCWQVRGVTHSKIVLLGGVWGCVCVW